MISEKQAICAHVFDTEHEGRKDDELVVIVAECSKCGVSYVKWQKT